MMLRPSMYQIISKNESYYSLVIGVAKRAREIAEQHVAPEDKLVQELGGGIQGFVAVIQFQKEADPVAGLRPGDLIEEVVDGQ